MTGTQIFILIMVGISCYFTVNMFDLHIKYKRAVNQEMYLQKVVEDQQVINNLFLQIVKKKEIEK